MLDVYSRAYYYKLISHLETKSVKWNSEPVAYGVLYSDPEDYSFFGRSIIDNSIAMKSCLMYAGIVLEGTVRYFNSISNQFQLNLNSVSIQF